jgi:tetrahedral aminopeptidase
MDARALAFLKDLIAAPSPSGFEMRAQECVRRRLKTASRDVETDVHGNVIGRLNRGAPLRVMLAGHVDEIGFLVSHLSEEGFLFVQPVGGVDLSLMPGQRVHVHSEKKRVLGVIGKKPIHLMTPEDRKKVPTAVDLWVDVGAKNRKDAARLAQVGDVVTVAQGMEFMENGLAVARGFDDKIGAFVVTETFCRLAKLEGLRVEVAAVSTVQEEIGLRGARTSAFGVEPHVGIAVDVGFASDYPGAEKKVVGDVRLGKGPILPRGATINPVVGRLLVEVARKKRIPFQITAEPRASGTDANAIQITRAGVASGLVSIPNRYMHTPAEMISLRDTEHAIRLLVEFVRQLKPGMDFTPRP